LAISFPSLPGKFINYFGVKPGGIFADIFTLLKMAGIVGVIVAGFTFQAPEALNILSFEPEIPSNLWSAVAAAMVGVLWSCGGWQHVTYVAGEAREQKRSIPFALILGTMSVVLLYILTNIAYLLMMPVDRIAASDRVAADALQIALGPVGAVLVSLVIFISVFGTAGIYTMTAPRIYYAMAKDGVFFKKVAEIHPKYKVPGFAILFQTAWAIILILSGTFYELITYVAFTDWIFFALAGFSVFLFRRRQPERERPYRTPGYPLIPAFFVGISAWFVINTLIGAPLQSLAGLGFLAVGVPVYYLWRKVGEKKRENQ
jgi:APA family basic amino acid/polyamine antiporter